MSDNNPTTQSKLDELKHSNDFDSVLSESNEKNNQLNLELGLQAPEGIANDEKELWELLFARIRNLYRKGIIDKDYIYGMFEIFDGQTSEQKTQAIEGLYKLEKQKEEEISYIEEGLDIHSMRQYLDEMVALFPPELRADFYYFIQHGTTIEESLEGDLNQQLAANQSSLAYTRLQNYVGGDKKSGKILTVSDLVGKFDLDDTGRSTQTYDINRNNNTTPQQNNS